MEILCEIHPTYKAIHPPRVKCEECRMAWLSAKEDELSEKLMEIREEIQQLLEAYIDRGEKWR